MVRRAVIACAVLLGLCGSTRPASACNCIQSGPACQTFWKTDAVFDATVDSITPTSRTEILGERSVTIAGFLVQLSVRQSWKGAAPGPLTVTTNAGDASCGFHFEVGRRYLVFARQNPDGGPLDVSLCSLTRAFDGTDDTARFLASLSEPPQGGRVFGAVTATYRRFSGNGDERMPIDALVRLSGGGKELTARSSEGHYEFGDLADGPYRLDLQVPAGYDVWLPSRTITIVNARACVEENFSLAPGGSISGRLVDRDGRPLPRIRVQATDAHAQPDEDGFSTVNAESDHDGYFTIKPLPPGTYVVGINLDDLPSTYDPYERTLYPANDAAHEFALELGQGADLGVWQVPPPPRVVTVQALVTWPDGSPAEGLYVVAWDVTGNPVDVARGAGGAQSGADGRAALELRVGRTYTFTARDARHALVPLSGPRVRVQPDMAPVRLTVKAPPRQ